MVAPLPYIGGVSGTALPLPATATALPGTALPGPSLPKMEERDTRPLVFNFNISSVWYTQFDEMGLGTCPFTYAPSMDHLLNKKMYSRKEMCKLQNVHLVH